MGVLRMKRNDIIKLLGLAFIAFFIRAIPHMFIIPYVGVEEGYMFLYAKRISSGFYFDLQQYPHTAILGVVMLHKLTQLPIMIIGSMWSPLMGGLSTIVTYFILRDVINVKNPFWGVLLFVGLDSHIYRSTLFATSAEATGIFLMLVFVWVYHKKNKFLSFLLLPVLLWTHLIPFFVSIIFIFSDIFTDTNWDKRMYTIMGVVIISIIAFVVFSPYDSAFIKIGYIANSFDIDILSKINMEDVSVLISTLLGTLILFGLSIIFGDKKKVFFVPLVLITLIGILSLLWYSLMISPYRVMVYVGILGIMGFSSIVKVQSISRYTAIFLVILMVTQVSCIGWERHLQVFDGITHDEYEMVEWLIGYDFRVWYSEVYWDDIGIELLALMMVPVEWDSDVVNNTEYSTWKRPFQLVDHTDGYIIVLDSVTSSRTKYIIYSDRFARAAMFRFPERAGRAIYRRYSIVDIWESDPGWEVVYEGSGGKIYKRSDYIP